MQVQRLIDVLHSQSQADSILDYYALHLDVALWKLGDDAADTGFPHVYARIKWTGLQKQVYEFDILLTYSLFSRISYASGT